jgi:hypothetical protein
VLKNYLTENLDKGFITYSQALFISLILFVKKPNNSLCFCIDYYKLNKLTKKDYYFLFLLDKTLVWISKTKIFTKLDIRQVFYYIRIDLISEELIIFRICYE